MVFFLTGVPGSGKTYYLVHYAESKKDTIDKSTNDKIYLQVVHNISGYKNGLYVDFGDEYLPKILELNKYYLSIKKDINKDDLLIKKAEDLGIYKILLIVDEAHLYFVNDFTEKGKERYYALLWFISYHRHLYVDIVLATQNLALVDYKFKSFAEFFVKAVPSSLRISFNPFSAPKFTYYYYPDSRMWNDTKFKTEKITAEKKIFDLYTSGDSVKKQKVYLETLLYIGALVLVLIALMYLFPSFESSTDNNTTSSAPASSVTQKPKHLDNSVPSNAKHRYEKAVYNNDDLLFDVVSCSVSMATCSSYLTDNKIPYFFFSKMMKLELVEVQKSTNQYGVITYYINVNMSKESYLSKFIIKTKTSRQKRKSKTLDFDFGDVKKHLKD